jgi:hypothetical protein
MRTIKQLTFALLMVMLAVTSCKKESEPTKKQNLNPVDQKLSNMIESFKIKGQSNLKSGEKLSIDSTVWYMEATANYTYGDGMRPTERTATDSIFVTLPIDPQQRVTLSDVWNKYEQMIDSIRVSYNSLADAEKQLIAVDLKVKTLTSTSITLKITPTFAVGQLPTNRPCDFDTITSYIWWNNCFPFPGAICPTDAAEEIEKRIMWCRGIPAGNYWFEEPQFVIATGGGANNPNWPGIPNYYETLMFFNTSTKPNFHGILSPTECNFYLNGTKWCIYTPDDLGGYKPAGKSFISVNVQGDAQFPLNSSQYFHWASIQYGILHVSPIGAEAL